MFCHIQAPTDENEETPNKLKQYVFSGMLPVNDMKCWLRLASKPFSTYSLLSDEQSTWTHGTPPTGCLSRHRLHTTLHVKSNSILQQKYSHFLQRFKFTSMITTHWGLAFFIWKTKKNKINYDSQNEDSVNCTEIKDRTSTCPTKTKLAHTKKKSYNEIKLE